MEMGLGFSHRLSNTTATTGAGSVDAKSDRFARQQGRGRRSTSHRAESDQR
jgi:hypothetical protein